MGNNVGAIPWSVRKSWVTLEKIWGLLQAYTFKMDPRISSLSVIHDFGGHSIVLNLIIFY